MVNSVSSVANDIHIQNLNSPEQPRDLFWASRELIAGGISGLSNLEMSRLLSRLFGAFLIIGGISLVSLAAFQIVAWPVGLLAVPCTIVAMAAIRYSLLLEDYGSPEQLEKFRREATQMTLAEALQAYGWNDLFRFGIMTPHHFEQKYRQHLKNNKNLVDVIDFHEKALRHLAACPRPRFNYEIPSLREFSRQWRIETSKMTCGEIFQKYPIDKLDKYGILDQGELDCLRKLKKSYVVFQKIRDESASQIQRQFEEFIAQSKQKYKREFLRAEQLYNNNYAVLELQGFELYYSRKRQEIQEQQNRSKQEARERFNRAVASCTREGSLSYQNLPKEDKILYDYHYQQFQVAENLANRTAQKRIEQINTERNERLIVLNTEENRVKEEKLNIIKAAKECYDLEVAEPRRQMEERLVPINATFASSALDLNGRYQAYLQINGLIPI